MTLYLLDANVLIRAHEDYYPIDRIPPFWAWLLQKAEVGIIKMPREIYGEIDSSKGMLADWLRQQEVKDALRFVEPTNMANVQQVIARGYAADLDDVESMKIGQDPFLVAAALGGDDRIVVTREISKPNQQRANRKIPDVCKVFDLPCINDFDLWRRLDFRV